MTRFLLSSAAALTLWAASFCNPTLKAQSQTTYMAIIPFQFRVDQKIMPGGTYLIDPVSAHSLRLHHLGDGHSADLLVFPIDEPGKAQAGTLRFSRYGSFYFLHEFLPPTEQTGRHSGSRFVRSSSEQRIARTLNGKTSLAQATPTEVVIHPVPQR